MLRCLCQIVIDCSLRGDERAIHRIFSSPDLNSNGLKSQHECQWQKSTEVIFIIVFPSLIFSKCRRPAINAAFLLLAFVFSLQLNVAGVLFWVPLWISTRPLRYWAHLHCRSPRRSFPFFVHSTQAASDGV